MKIVLFDIDGTLLSTGGAGYRAIDAIFANLHGVQNITAGFSAGGMTDDLILQELFHKALARSPAPNELELIRKHYLDEFAHHYKNHARLKVFPHVVATVQALAKRADISLGLATGNYKKTAYQKIASIGLAEYFAYGGFGCDSASREELTTKAYERALKNIKTKPKAVYVVGDTTRDIDCARHIGAKVIAVATGAHSRERLANANPDFLIEDFSEFPEI